MRLRRKYFTIPEGHFTGSKDIDKIPGTMEVIGKSVLASSSIGAVVGSVVKDSSAMNGALTGGKYGLITGILLKLLVNHLHKPMDKVKYREIDKNLRTQFGIFSSTGLTIGDTKSRRKSVDDKFSFNDRNVTDYKVNIAIQDNKVVMYTYKMTKEELKKTSDILDYYCKKYYSMEYNSHLINEKINSYSVSIVFTNYQIISNFLIELNDELGCKINLLNSKALVDGRISSEEKTFSLLKTFNKYDLFKILSRSGSFLGLGLATNTINSPKGVISSLVLGGLLEGLLKLNSDEKSKLGLPMSRREFGNTYLNETLKKLHYINNYDYHIGLPTSKLNMSMINGKFLITAVRGSKEAEKIDNKVWSKMKNVIVRSEIGNGVIIYSYTITSKSEFELIIKRLMTEKLEPNIFEK